MASPSPDQAAESDTRVDLEAGARVTYTDPSGDRYEAVVSKVWYDCVNLLYRPDGDGSFEEGSTSEYAIATSVQRPANADGTFCYTPGWTEET